MLAVLFYPLPRPRNMKSVALLVGINAYPSAPLRGCLPDVADMHSYLLRERDWPTAHMKLLTDRDATRKGIMDGIALMAREKPDLALFAYSGHGTRVRDVDGDEAQFHSGTTYDQAIVPVDYDRTGFLTDDVLYDAFSEMPAETKIIYHLDSCFSARSERALIARTKEFYHRRIRKQSDRTLPIRYVSSRLLQATRQQKTTGGGSTPRPVLLLSGCRSTETSADAWISGSGYRGAFTYYLLRSARALGPQASYHAVIEDARRLIEINRFTQRPQITPSAHMPIGWPSQPFLQ